MNKTNNHLKNKDAFFLIPHTKIYFFRQNKIEYEYQKRFIWLGKQSLDFYLPKYNIAIECQGEQHFKPVDFGGKGIKWATEQFQYNVKKDEQKKPSPLLGGEGVRHCLTDEV